MNERQFGWLIGYLEGEGSFNAWLSGCGRYLQTAIQVTSTDKDALEKLYDIVGGKLTGPYIPGGHGKKPIYRWMEGRRDRVVYLLNLILPYMTVRRQRQIKKMLKRIQENPLKRKKAVA